MTSPLDRLTTALADRYRIERELGQGGMATVYLAQDLKHDRKVALKVLKPELAAVLGAERFVVEIKTTAALQHPHILPLFDSGTAGQRDGGTEYLYYVMPFIDGETLRGKLDREGQLGVDEAVQIARDVAEALDHAHQHGVIHRDIKPENILLANGRPMVADFGIALAVSAAAGGRMTETGLSLGTPHYMSPEQATAEKEITARSDIYSLGSVLYEMLTGEPPHMGNSAQAIIMKIVTEDAQPVTRLRKSVPLNVAAAVAKAVERLPADRFETARGFADALANPAFAATTAVGRAGAASVAGRPWIRDPRSWAALAAVVTLSAVAILGWPVSDPPAIGPETLRFTVEGPADSSVLAIDVQRRGYLSSPIVSPDGKYLAFGARKAEGESVYVRSLDSFELFEIPGGGRAPVFSPDGGALVYSRGADIWRFDLTERVPARLASLPEVQWDIRSIVWHPGGHILVAGGQGVWSVPTAGGTPELLIPTDARGGERFEGVGVFPDGRLLLNVRTPAGPRIEVAAEDGTGREPILPGVEQAWSVDDILLFVQAGQLRASAFDPDQLRLTGTAVVLPDSIPGQVGRSLAWVDGPNRRALEPVWVQRDGRATPLPVAPGSYRWPRISPDGGRLAVGISGANIKTVALGSRTIASLNSGTEPVWSWDSRMLYSSRENRPLGGILLQVADGSRDADTLLALDNGDAWPTALSPDGRWLLYYGATKGVGTEGDATDPNDLFFLDLSNRESRRVRIPGAQRGARFSPDGRWVAYQSTESGEENVFVRPWPAMDARYQVSTGGGVEPIWSRDGRELFFRQRDAVMAVGITVRDSTIERGSPQQLFAGNYATDRSGDQSWDIGPDGRFLMLRPVPGPRMDLHLVLNWIAEVRARLARAQ